MKRIARRIGGVPISRRAALWSAAVGATGAAAGALSAEQAAPAAARTGRSYDFGQDWLFGGRYVAGAELPGWDDSRFERVTVPHTVTGLSWADWDYRGWQHRWIYRKHFTVSAREAAGGRVLVTFDGVMTSAAVVLNGRTLSAHAGGYLPWTTDLTSGLKAGGNVLAVIVDGGWLLDVPPDALPGGPGTMDYLQPAGIYRDVRLDVVPQAYLADVFARPVNVLTSSRAVRVQATVSAAAVPAGQVASLTAVLLDSGGTPRGTASTVARITRPGAHTVTLVLRPDAAVAYWSPEHPDLYTVRTTLAYQGASPRPGGRHVVSKTIGFREAVFREDGFYLNGSRYQIFGLNRHQLYPYLGMAAPARLQRRDALILKNQLNVNMVRCSHYPQSPHFLDACDEVGIMVWQEPPGWGFMGNTAFQRNFLDNVRDMVVRDRSRPSVIVWGARLDETKNYPALYAQARRLAYAYDGSRQTAGAVAFRSTAGWAEDVFSYDDYHIVDDVPELYPPVSGVPYLVSEAVGAGVDPHYLWTDPPATLARQGYAHALVHNQAGASPRYSGLLAWAGIDYYSVPNNSTPQSAAKNWHTIRTPGVLDVFRVPKPGAAIYQAQVDPAIRPVLIPMFCWDDRTPPGGGAMFATNCDRLELYLDGTHWMTVRPDTRRFGHLPHPPAFADLTVHPVAPGAALPELRADGYAGQARVATLRMTADTSRDRLQLTTADSQLSADGSDATAITFRAVDAYGNRRPGIAGDVTLGLTGPATLIAANPFPFAAFGGVGGAFVRSLPGSAGRVTVTARHATLGSASVPVIVSPARS